MPHDRKRKAQIASFWGYGPPSKQHSKHLNQSNNAYHQLPHYSLPVDGSQAINRQPSSGDRYLRANRQYTSANRYSTQNIASQRSERISQSLNRVHQLLNNRPQTSTFNQRVVDLHSNRGQSKEANRYSLWETDRRQQIIPASNSVRELVDLTMSCDELDVVEVPTKSKPKVLMNNKSPISQPANSRQALPTKLSQPVNSRQALPTKLSQPANSRQALPTKLSQPANSRQALPMKSFQPADMGQQQSQMASVVMGVFERVRQDPATYNRKLNLVDKLYHTIRRDFEDCGLYLVGSSVNGFGTKKSDIDLCLMLPNVSELRRPEIINILYQIKRSISSLSNVYNIAVIRAKVPILDFNVRHEDTEVDININHKSDDSKVQPLVVFVKTWAKFQNINSARDNSLSSYVLSLMVIHYLQCGVEGPAVLVSLQRVYPNLLDEADVSRLRIDYTFDRNISQNNMDIGQLLLGFFKYYAEQFDFTRDVGCVRTGSKLDITDVNGREFNSWNACMFMEDPIERTNAARCVFNRDVFTRIRRVIRKSYHQLKDTLDPLSIITNPF